MDKEGFKKLRRYEHVLYDLNRRFYEDRPKNIPRNDPDRLRKFITQILSVAEEAETTAHDLDDPDFYNIAGESYRDAARFAEILKDYKQGWKLNKNAAKMYHMAASEPHPDDKIRTINRKNRNRGMNMLQRYISKGNYENQEVYLLEEAKRDRRNAALYRATEHMHPLRRNLVRRLKTLHVVILFILSLILIYPKITGNVISSEINTTLGMIGILFFIAFLIGFSFLLSKRKLSKVDN
jgi:hypothetical protein